ncbi:unnamed protein product [Vitrella brassicaformis CCMP3155]|uniref:Uncharacterized protein n=1 Tax=Vitrella brassicaformis (strain CCMP3155) TaxID=1169540 RepID=A0A0G4FN00_VITBC|nr:unnamed protein product [Vitrella brassicaformis CCMP3155]|eukprot:CEM15624.1 unnamed protein product [Vitrella brassicaformis CCMP3155]
MALLGDAAKAAHALPLHFWADAVATVFAYTATVVSFIHIMRHVHHTQYWGMTKYTVRILLLVPVFSIDCWWSLLVGSSDRNWTEVFTVIRELYEAFVLFSFLQFMLAYLGGPQNLARLLKEEGNPTTHFIPFRWFLRDWHMGGEFLAMCFRGVLQYIPISILTTIVSLVAWSFRVYKEGRFTFQSVYPWLTLLKNFSQIWAMYSLILFYHAIHHKLVNIRPLAKFLCIKGLVFFTFWQSVAIAALQYVGVIKAEKWELIHTWSTREIAIGVGNFVLCIEMLGFAIAHCYAYPYDEFSRPLVDHARLISGELTRSVAGPFGASEINTASAKSAKARSARGATRVDIQDDNDRRRMLLECVKEEDEEQGGPDEGVEVDRGMERPDDEKSDNMSLDEKMKMGGGGYVSMMMLDALRRRLMDGVNFLDVVQAAREVEDVTGASTNPRNFLHDVWGGMSGGPPPTAAPHHDPEQQAAPSFTTDPFPAIVNGGTHESRDSPTRESAASSSAAMSMSSAGATHAAVQPQSSRRPMLHDTQSLGRQEKKIGVSGEGMKWGKKRSSGS